MTDVAVLINPGARQGRSVLSETQLHSLLESCALRAAHQLVLTPDQPFTDQAKQFVESAIHEKGIHYLVAVGGDGTAGLLAQSMLNAPEDLVMGAVGVGSSNDLHKPSCGSFRGIPYRLNFQGPSIRDCVSVRTDRGDYCFLNSFSVGFIADANHRFNHPGAVVQGLKRCNASAAIAYTAFSQLLHHGCQELWISVNGSEPSKKVCSSLSVVKNPNVAGSFQYEPLVGMADGMLALHEVEGCTRLSFVRIMLGMLRGRFVGRAGTGSSVAKIVRLSGAQDLVFEVDGEVYAAKHIELRVHDKKFYLAG